MYRYKYVALIYIDIDMSLQATYLKQRPPLPLSSLEHLQKSALFDTRVLQCVAACCSVLQCVAVSPCRVSLCLPLRSRKSQLYSHLILMCCSMLQCVAVRCSVLQCVAVCCSVPLSLIQLSPDEESQKSAS